METHYKFHGRDNVLEHIGRKHRSYAMICKPHYLRSWWSISTSCTISTWAGHNAYKGD